jgi:hypothetical protein
VDLGISSSCACMASKPRGLRVLLIPRIRYFGRYLEVIFEVFFVFWGY